MANNDSTTTPGSDAKYYPFQFDNTEEALDRVYAVQAYIEETESLLSRLKEEIKTLAYDELIKAARAVSEDAAMELANHLYWDEDITITTDPVYMFLSAYGAKPQNVANYVGYGLITVECSKHGEYTTATKSRHARKEIRQHPEYHCPTCKDERERASAQHHVNWERERQERLNEIQRLRSMPYSQYLQTDHWQGLRAKMLKRAGFACQVCNTRNVSLHVHHRTYENRGDEDYKDLVVLCETCHRIFHENGQVVS